jgi:hypothetical protein
MRLILIAIVALLPALSNADSSMGCGLGTMIWKKNSIVSALFRATTNHSFSSQLFGITTGTSGCSQHSIVKREMYPVYFAEANLPELRYEMAQGQGEYVATFAEVLGCSNSVQAEFTNWARGSYSKLFSNPNATSQDFLKGLGKELKKTSFGTSCDNTALI